MSSVLIIIGDRGRARILSFERAGRQVRELQDLVNPALFLREGLFSHDHQGRVMNRSRGSRTALGKREPHKRLSSLRFARLVADTVHTECEKHPYVRLFLLAEPEFVGMLRPRLTAQASSPPLTVIPRNITRHETADILAYLPEHPWRPAVGRETTR